MADWTVPFSHTLRWVRVSNMVEVGPMAGILSGGKLDWNQDTALKRSGSVDCADLLDLGPDCLRLFADVSFLDGMSESVCLGTYRASQPTSRYTSTSRAATADLYSTLVVLRDMMFQSSYTARVGADPVAAAAQLVRQAGLVPVADPCTVRLPTSRTYGLPDSDDTYLDAVNDLLDVAGFGSADVDPYGRIVMRRYVEPSRRPIAARWAEGPLARFLADVTVDQDDFDVANCVKVVSGTADKCAYGVARNDDPGDRWSVPRVGREVWHVERVNEPLTTAQCATRARATLAAGARPTRSVTISHVWDGTDIMGAVEFAWPTAGLGERLTVRTMSIDLGAAGLLVEAECRGFA